MLSGHPLSNLKLCPAMGTPQTIQANASNGRILQANFSQVAELCNLHGFEGIKNFCADNVLDLGSIGSERTHQADPQYTEKPGQTV